MAGRRCVGGLAAAAALLVCSAQTPDNTISVAWGTSIRTSKTNTALQVRTVTY
jgi:hypothetical protein